MSRFEFRLFHAANAAVIVTGAVYAWMRYALSPIDEYAIVNHPWQPHMLHLHIVAAPLLVAVLGHFWGRHVWPAWQSRKTEGRRSGLGLAGAIVPMIASGYLLQISVSAGWRQFWIGVHVAASALWILGCAVHLMAHAAARRESRM